MATTVPATNTPNICYYDIFIRATLGRYLPECLQEVTEVKPADPIEYIAKWLYKVYDSEMYYKAKVAYLREMHQLGESLAREKQAHDEKIQPFILAMQAERWNYFASLHAELEALEEVMAQVDAEVDEGTKLRFLEVQMLIREEQDFVKGEYITPQGRESIKTLEEEPEADKPMSSYFASARSSLQATEEKKSVVMIEVPAAEEAESGVMERRQLSAVPRRGRRYRRPPHQRRFSTAGMSSVESTQAADDTRKCTDSDRVLDLDSGRGLRSLQKKEKKDDDLRQNKMLPGSSQMVATCFHSNALDESESFVVDSTRSSEESFDSEIDQQERPEGCGRKQQIDSMSAKDRCLDALMRYSECEDFENQQCEIDGKSRNERLSASFPQSRYSLAEGSRRPVMTPRGKDAKERATTWLPGDSEKAYSHRTRHGLSWQASYENTHMIYQEDDGEVPEEADLSRMPTRDDCGGFHLPPLHVQRDTSGVATLYEDGRFEKHPLAVSRHSESFGHVVPLPPIATSKEGTGTLVMTTGGHIAFVNKQLGVIASNSLKIRRVHPIDKPEMWARRNFRPQSFYDHELYSETDHAFVEGEDDDRWYSSVSRLALDERIESPYRRWKRPKEDDDSY